MTKTNHRVALWALAGCLGWAGLAPSEAGAADVPSTLQAIHADSLWGEITLETGRVRQIQVQSLRGDSVAVREVIGALHVRPATYPLASIRSAREIGVQRIPQRLAPYRTPRSATVAMGLELVVPGAGFFYAGNARQGYSMLGFAAMVAGTAFYTGNDGAAGWAPFAAWIKIASLAQVRDQVRADNGAWKDRAEGLAATRGPRLPLVGLRF
jgi:hypothetical protein